MSELQHCDICGEDYDPIDFDQVLIHMQDPHRPVAVSGIKGTKISQWIESEGQTMYYEAYIDIFKRDLAKRDVQIAELKAKLAAMREPLWMLREEHEAEVAALRGKIAEAEGKAPRWVRYTSDEWESLVRDGWKFAIDSEDDPLFPHLLMVPPVPLPEPEP